MDVDPNSALATAAENPTGGRPVAAVTAAETMPSVDAAGRRFVVVAIATSCVAALGWVGVSVHGWAATGLWQYIITGLASVVLAVVAGVSIREIHRGGSLGPALERVYLTVGALMLLTPLWFEHVQTTMAAGYLLMVLATGPRVLPLARTDRWIYLAIAVGVVASAGELVPLPTRLPRHLQYDIPFEVSFAACLVGAALVAWRVAGYLPLRSKLGLGFLAVALAPVAVLNRDATNKAANAQFAAVGEVLGNGAASTARLWASWFHQQRERMEWLASSPVLEAACSGRAVAVAGLVARMEAVGNGWAGLALWSPEGRLLARSGTAPDQPLAAGETLGQAADGRWIVAQPACGGGSLTAALARDALDRWTAAARIRHQATVIVRDAAGTILTGTLDDPEALAALPAWADLVHQPYAVGMAIEATQAYDQSQLQRLPGHGWLAATTAVEPPGWSLTLLRDEAVVAAVVTQRRREIHGFTLLAVVLASVAALLLGHGAAAPLRRLAAAMTRFTSGEVDVRAKEHAHDEIGGLAVGFNQMAAQVGGLLQSLAQRSEDLQREIHQRTAQEVRLQALNTELAAARDQALAANRAKSTFLAHMSHELRTPLNAIIGYGELIQETAVEQGATMIVEDTGNIVRSAQHLLTLINDILDLSKIEAGKLDMVVDNFDVTDVVREVVETITPMVDSNSNTLIVRMEATNVSMRSDRTKLRQTLLNLLSNAAKFTVDGNIELLVRDESIAGVACHVFRVRDAGVGIPKDALATLFDPFTQVVYPRVRKHSGTGLGLAITRRLCWLMGGEIDVDSEIDVGTTFTITIPSVFQALASGESWRPLRGKRARQRNSLPWPVATAKRS